MEKFKNIINNNAPYFRAAIIAEFIFIFVFTVFFANCIVPTGSMEPTIKAPSRVIANRLSYNNETPKRFDPIVFKFPDHERVNYCKRIIGLPGEVVEIKDGKTYINDEAINEPFIKNTFTGSYGPFYVPKAGDVITYNKDTDTAYYGEYNIGTKDFVNMYCSEENGVITVAKDCYFLMGDNRDSSADARFWKNKYVTDDKIVGKIIWNLSKCETVK